MSNLEAGRSVGQSSNENGWQDLQHPRKFKRRLVPCLMLVKEYLRDERRRGRGRDTLKHRDQITRKAPEGIDAYLKMTPGGVGRGGRICAERNWRDAIKGIYAGRT